MALEEKSDEELIMLTLRGDLSAFSFLVTRYQQFVLSVVSKHVPANYVTEVTHDSYVRVWRSLSKFRSQASFKTWLYRLTIRECADYWRSRYHRREIGLEDLSIEGKEMFNKFTNSIAEVAFVGEQQRQCAYSVLDWALSKLNAGERMVITLLYLEEKTVTETAHILGISQILVKVRAFRARQKLKSLIDNEDRKKDG